MGADARHSRATGRLAAILTSRECSPDDLTQPILEAAEDQGVTTLLYRKLASEKSSGRLADVRDMFDERFVRMWRLYLAMSMVSFECGTLQLFQILFAPGKNNSIPWTRVHQYADTPQPAGGEAWRRVAAGEAE